MATKNLRKEGFSVQCSGDGVPSFRRRPESRKIGYKMSGARFQKRRKDRFFVEQECKSLAFAIRMPVCTYSADGPPPNRRKSIPENFPAPEGHDIYSPFSVPGPVVEQTFQENVTN
jgi:hypothetical protein